ncbi:MAG: hypothetical protein V2G42_08820 [bacterium JZ-2024 1]
MDGRRETAWERWAYEIPHRSRNIGGFLMDPTQATGPEPPDSAVLQGGMAPARGFPGVLRNEGRNYTDARQSGKRRSPRIPISHGTVKSRRTYRLWIAFADNDPVSK